MQRQAQDMTSRRGQIRDFANNRHFTFNQLAQTLLPTAREATASPKKPAPASKKPKTQNPSPAKLETQQVHLPPIGKQKQSNKKTHQAR